MHFFCTKCIKWTCNEEVVFVHLWSSYILSKLLNIFWLNLEPYLAAQAKVFEWIWFWFISVKHKNNFTCTSNWTTVFLKNSSVSHSIYFISFHFKRQHEVEKTINNTCIHRVKLKFFVIVEASLLQHICPCTS